MCFLVLYLIGFIGVILSIHYAGPWLEISMNKKIMIPSKCWTIVWSTINCIICNQYRVDFFSGVREEKRCFTVIFLMGTIWDPFTWSVSSKHIPILGLANYDCWSLIATFPPKSLSSHSMLRALKQKAYFRCHIFILLCYLN